MPRPTPPGVSGYQTHLVSAGRLLALGAGGLPGAAAAAQQVRVDVEQPVQRRQVLVRMRGGAGARLVLRLLRGVVLRERTGNQVTSPIIAQISLTQLV